MKIHVWGRAARQGGDYMGLQVTHVSVSVCVCMQLTSGFVKDRLLVLDEKNNATMDTNAP